MLPLLDFPLLTGVADPVGGSAGLEGPVAWLTRLAIGAVCQQGCSGSLAHSLSSCSRPDQLLTWRAQVSAPLGP